MKKILSFTSPQTGFILPYVLFFIAFVFIALSVSLNLYEDEMRIADKQTEQLKIETLLQMGRAQFKEDMEQTTDLETPVSYQFPYGDVKIDYVLLDGSNYHLYMTTSTNNDTTLTITNRIKLKTPE